MAKKQPLYPHVPKSVERLPQTSPDGNNQKGMYLNLTREQVTETIISNLVQAGILLTSEAGHYREVLETYDNITMLKVLLHSQLLRGK